MLPHVILQARGVQCRGPTNLPALPPPERIQAAACRRGIGMTALFVLMVCWPELLATAHGHKGGNDQVRH
jgi:hypothetical protein